MRRWPDARTAVLLAALAGITGLNLLAAARHRVSITEHVLAELEAYAELVPVGGYVIVQDTVVNGHPLAPEWGPGPWEAVDAFLARTDRFEPDRSREKLLFTHNPRGFLKRVR